MSFVSKYISKISPFSSEKCHFYSHILDMLEMVTFRALYPGYILFIQLEVKFIVNINLKNGGKLYIIVICIHAPPPPTGIMTFQIPGISPAMWGAADGNNPILSPTLQNRKSHREKFPLLKPWYFPGTAGINNQKVIALHLSLAIPIAIPVGGWGGCGYK